MARIIVILLQLILVGAVVYWFSLYPGQVQVKWMGYQLTTSVGITALILVTSFLLIGLLLKSVFWILKIPKRLSNRYASYSSKRGVDAIHGALRAYLAQDGKRLFNEADHIKMYLHDDNLCHYFKAKAHEFEGNHTEARENFLRLTSNKEDRFLGEIGCLDLALVDGSPATIKNAAKTALKTYPNSPKVLEILQDALIAEENYQEAIPLVDIRRKMDHVSLDQYTKLTSHLYLALGTQYQQNQKHDLAFDLLEKAFKMESALPQALQYVPLLIEQKKFRKAHKIIEETWTYTPHSDLAEHYVTMDSKLSPVQQYEKYQNLLHINSTHPISQFVEAQIATRAKLWGKARDILSTLLKNEYKTQPVFELMAKIEKEDNVDKNAHQHWIQKSISADLGPAWRCTSCQTYADQWTVSCRNCNAFGSMHWGNA